MPEAPADGDRSYTFLSDGHHLAGHLAKPGRAGYGGVNALVICHGFPTPSNGLLNAGMSYFDLADRVADRLGWVVLAFAYRGCGESTGQFSLGGWLDDVKAAVREVKAMPNVTGVWIAGFGTGGVLGMRAAADIDEVLGVAAVAPPADFDDWAKDPEGLLSYARHVGAIDTDDFPEDFESWAKELTILKGVSAAENMAPKPLLILHGAQDAVVPVFDARVLADAHGTADLRIIAGAGHRLRFDPRAVAILMGWLDRSGLAPDPRLSDQDDEG